MHPTSSSLSYQSHWIQVKFMLLKYFWAWTLSEAIPFKKKLANPFPACAGLLYPAPPVHAAIVSDFILFRSYACSYNCCVFISGSIYQWNYPLEFRKHSFLKVIYHFWFLYNLSIPSLRMILEPWEKACYMCVPFGPECSAISYSLHFNQWWRNILFSEESCYWRALTSIK